MPFFFLKEKGRKRSKNLAGLSLFMMAIGEISTAPARDGSNEHVVRPPRWWLRDAPLVDRRGYRVLPGSEKRNG